MSQMSEAARSKARDKVERLTRSSNGKVDASGWKEPLGMNGGIQTGPRPVSRRQYRRGGKVHGEAAAKRADRKPRAAGGVTKTDGGLINEDIKEANQSRAGTKHIGGMKRGGRAHKTMGGLALPNWADSVSRGTGGRTGKMIGGPMMGRPEMPGRVGGGAAMPVAQPMPMRPGLQRPMMRKGGGKIPDGTRPEGGRLARKGGGRAKKGMNVNIIIAPPSAAGAKPPMPMGGPPPGAAPGLHQAPPPMPPSMAGAPPPAGGPPPGPPMMRKSGGRAGYPITTGAGGANARLEKVRAYGGA
jgi:hypothetical protein